MLTINDLATSVELDREALTEVRGGWDFYMPKLELVRPVYPKYDTKIDIAASIDQQALNDVEVAFSEHFDVNNNQQANIDIF